MITPLGQAADINLRTIAGPAAAPDSEPVKSLDRADLQHDGGRMAVKAELPAVAVTAPELPFDGSLLPGLQDEKSTGRAGKPANGEKTDSQAATAGEKKANTNDKGEEVNAQGLTKEEQDQVKDLKERDREVKAHEQAHARVGGQYAGSPNYKTEKGPDGQQYATSGHVSIDVSPVAGDPEATVRKMEKVRAAALAPADPSGQDQRVAADAQQKAAQARVDAAEQRRAEFESTRDSSTSAAAANQGTDAQSGPSVSQNADQVAGAVSGSAAGATTRRLDAGAIGGLQGDNSINIAKSAKLDNAGGLGLSSISQSGGSQSAKLEQSREEYKPQSYSRQRLAMAAERYDAAARLNSDEYRPRVSLSA